MRTYPITQNLCSMTNRLGTNRVSRRVHAHHRHFSAHLLADVIAINGADTAPGDQWSACSTCVCARTCARALPVDFIASCMSCSLTCRAPSHTLDVPGSHLLGSFSHRAMLGWLVSSAAASCAWDRPLRWRSVASPHVAWRAAMRWRIAAMASQPWRGCVLAVPGTAPTPCRRAPARGQPASLPPPRSCRGAAG